MRLAPHPQRLSQAKKGVEKLIMNTNEFKMIAARANRQEQTEAEAILWQLLRNHNFEGIKFRRQHPIKEYIVDFFSYELNLAIELDGGYYNHPEQKEKDELRDLHLKDLGYKVLRYHNDIVLKNQEHIIYEDILKRKNSLPPLLGERNEERGLSILSTKKLQPNQRELLLNAGLSFVEYDAITIRPIDFKLPRKLENIIITSKNGASAFLTRTQELPLLEERAGVKYFCVGKKATALLTDKGLNVVKTAQNGAELARFIAKNHKKETFYYFCGKQRREELPSILNNNRVDLNEVYVYETSLTSQKFTQEFDAIMFFSPSGVKSFFEANHHKLPLLEERVGVRCFCIGETTAQEASIYFENVVVSNATTIESTIAKTVNYLKKITN